MVKIPWFGDSDVPTPSRSSVSDDDISARVKAAEERAKKAAKIVNDSGGTARTDAALKHVRDAE